MSVNFDTAKQIVESLPLKTGTQVFLECARAQHLDVAMDDETMNTAKSIGRGITTYIALPIFASLGAAYNGLTALAKGIMGTVTMIQRGKEDEEARKCFESAVEHLSFAIYDAVMAVLTLACGAAYGYNPEAATKMHEAATGEGVAQARSGTPVSDDDFDRVGDDDEQSQQPVEKRGFIRDTANHYFDIVAAKAGLAPRSVELV
jgi:hypothetical protein